MNAAHLAITRATPARQTLPIVPADCPAYLMALPSERGAATYDALCILVYIAAVHLLGEREYEVARCSVSRSPNPHRHKHIGRHRLDGGTKPAPAEGYPGAAPLSVIRVRQTYEMKSGSGSKWTSRKTSQMLPSVSRPPRGPDQTSRTRRSKPQPGPLSVAAFERADH